MILVINEFLEKVDSPKKVDYPKKWIPRKSGFPEKSGFSEKNELSESWKPRIRSPKLFFRIEISLLSIATYL